MAPALCSGKADVDASAFLLNGSVGRSYHGYAKRRRGISCVRHLKSRPRRHATADDVTVTRLTTNVRHATFALRLVCLKISSTRVFGRGLEFVFHARRQKLDFQVVQEDTASTQLRITSGLPRHADIIGTLNTKLKSIILRARHKKAVPVARHRCEADTIRQSRTRGIFSVCVIIWVLVWSCIV